MVGQQLLVGEKAAHDVLRRVGAVDAHNEVFRPPVTQLPLLDHDAVRVGEPCRASDIDRDGIGARVDNTSVHEHGLLAHGTTGAHRRLARRRQPPEQPAVPGAGPAVGRRTAERLAHAEERLRLQHGRRLQHDAPESPARHRARAQHDQLSVEVGDVDREPHPERVHRHRGTDQDRAVDPIAPQQPLEPRAEGVGHVERRQHVTAAHQPTRHARQHPT